MIYKILCYFNFLLKTGQTKKRGNNLLTIRFPRLSLGQVIPHRRHTAFTDLFLRDDP